MIRILASNLADTGTLTASSEDVNFTAINVQHPFRSKPWRSAGISGEWLKWDLGSAQAANAIVLLNTNCDATTTIQFQASGADSWVAPAVDETVPFDSKIIILFFPESIYQWWRLLITNSSGTAIDVGRVLFGKYFEPTKNYNKGWSHALVDPSRTSRTPAGQKHTDKKEKFAKITLPFNSITDDEKYNDYLSLINSLGTDRDFVLAMDATNRLHDLTFYGRFTVSPNFANITDAGTRRHSFTLEFEESL